MRQSVRYLSILLLLVLDIFKISTRLQITFNIYFDEPYVKREEIRKLSVFHIIFLNLSDDRQKNLVKNLLIDEVYVKSALQYQGGQVNGSAANKP